jgi:hypothetical protein
MDINWSVLVSENIKEIFSGTSTIVGALLGAGFTVLGVYMTNRTNQESLKNQLDHEKQLRKEEYERNLKRDVYLGFAETVGAQLDLISRLNHFDKSNSELFERVTALSGNSAKMHVVARAEVLQILASVTNEMDRTQLQLMAERNRIGILYRMMKHHEQLRDESLIRIKSCADLMMQINIDGNLDKHKQEVLNRNFELHQKHFDDQSAMRQEVATRFNNELANFTVLCSSERARILGLLPPLVAAIRSDIGLDIDIEKYTGALEQHKPMSRAEVERLILIEPVQSEIK